jgi:uncharacterized SAM-binding protein YcdF (DUF218 family)
MMLFRTLTRIPGMGLLNPWRWMRRLAYLAVGIYLLSATAEVVLASQRNANLAPDRTHPIQAIVVLGAAQYNGRPSPVLQHRLDHALALYNDKVAPLIVVTGGRQAGDRTTEAGASAEYLMKHGVPDARIAREVKGSDTYLSLAAAARFLKKRNVRRVVLVTDGYHAARVWAIASEVGLDPITSPATSTLATDRLLKESAGIALGRIIGFRRLSAWVS